MSPLSSVSILKTTGEELSHSRWIYAMVYEMSALNKSGTWEPVSLPVGKSTVGCLWVYVVKIGPDVRLIDLRLVLLPKGILRYLG